MNPALCSTQNVLGICPGSNESGQGLVEYALILALVVLVVIVALLATGGQVRNLYSDIITTMCNNHVGC